MAILFNRLVIPFDLDMAMCSGSVDRGISVEKNFVRRRAYAEMRHCTARLSSCFLSADIDRHFDHAAVVIGHTT